jgi:hypothetical protein
MYPHFWVAVPLFPYMLTEVLVLVVGSLMLVFRPPIAIVLASSKPTSSMLLTTVAQAVFPYRTVALLDEQLVGATMFFVSQVDNLRTIAVSDWKDVVRRAVDEVAVIVIDARFRTQQLSGKPGSCWNHRESAGQFLS